MFQIAICDDEREFNAKLEEVILNKYDENEVDVDVFESGSSLINEIVSNDHFYDLIFLDIEMMKMNGVQTGQILRNELKNEMSQIVYVSSKEDYYKQLFEIRPNNFLLKPIDEGIVIKEIEKAMRLANKFNISFIYKKSYDKYKVFAKDILYFESNDKKIRIVTSTYEDVFYDRLENVLKRLDAGTFFQIHKSYVVNLLHVMIFHYEKLEMTNGDIIAISQSKRKEVRAKQLFLMENT